MIATRDVTFDKSKRYDLNKYDITTSLLKTALIVEETAEMPLDIMPQLDPERPKG